MASSTGALLLRSVGVTHFEMGACVHAMAAQNNRHKSHLISASMGGNRNIRHGEWVEIHPWSEPLPLRQGFKVFTNPTMFGQRVFLHFLVKRLARYSERFIDGFQIATMRCDGPRQNGFFELCDLG